MICTVFIRDIKVISRIYLVWILLLNSALVFSFFRLNKIQLHISDLLRLFSVIKLVYWHVPGIAKTSTTLYSEGAIFNNRSCNWYTDPNELGNVTTNAILSVQLEWECSSKFRNNEKHHRLLFNYSGFADFEYSNKATWSERPFPLQQRSNTLRYMR